MLKFFSSYFPVNVEESINSRILPPGSGCVIFQANADNIMLYAVMTAFDFNADQRERLIRTHSHAVSTNGIVYVRATEIGYDMGWQGCKSIHGDGYCIGIVATKT
jgi:hypothetical protein